MNSANLNVYWADFPTKYYVLTYNNASAARFLRLTQ